MELLRTLLNQPHICVITRQPDVEMRQIQDTIEHKALVEGRADLEALFSGLLATKHDNTPKTLDLIGHSTGKGFLKLGDWVIDAERPGVTAYFRELADNDVLPRLGINAVRLLGCHTAGNAKTRATIRTLTQILQTPVYGTTNILFRWHYDANGFIEQREYMLACVDDFRDGPPSITEPSLACDPRLLDLDALPMAPLDSEPTLWPLRLATHDDTRSILRLIRRAEGAAMPGLLASPSAEIAMPSARPDLYHRIQVVLDATFVRVYPDGENRPGIVYPVRESHALAALIESLHSVTQRAPM
jgi:hypothetical protein